MSVDLATIFGSLQRHHVATAAEPLPPVAPGVAWVWGRDGIYKRGVNADLDLMVRVGLTPPVPGLAGVATHARWRMFAGRIPGDMLVSLLADARKATRALGGSPLQVAIEKQYFVVWDDADSHIRLRAPGNQDGDPSRVRYQMPESGRIMVDVHSHAEMPVFFSKTDDADDQGLSISVVIGHIFSKPELLCRLNVHGHRQVVPIQMVFTHAGPFIDRGGSHAPARH